MRLDTRYQQQTALMKMMMKMSYYRKGGWFIALVMLSAINLAYAETVRLADCPEEVSFLPVQE